MVGMILAMMMMTLVTMMITNLAGYGYLSKSKLMGFLSANSPANVDDPYLILDIPTNIFVSDTRHTDQYIDSYRDSLS